MMAMAGAPAPEDHVNDLEPWSTAFTRNPSVHRHTHGKKKQFVVTVEAFGMGEGFPSPTARTWKKICTKDRVTQMRATSGGYSGRFIFPTEPEAISATPLLIAAIENAVSDPATMFYHPFKKTWSLHSTSTDDIEVNCRVKDGDVQSMSFGSEPTSTGNCVHPPPPPFYLLDAPPFDVMMNAEKLAMHNAARVMLKEKEVDACVEKRGYLGKPKGIKQVLWERGLWKEGMIGLVKKDNAKYEEKGPMCASSALPRFCVRERCAAEAHRRAWAYHG
eukprot:m.292070 g.292070  ORF g.292070 m.292070 type:complete len:275 (+) comp16233_c0_seq2:190-1014(+)